MGERHLDPETAAEAAELLGAKRVIPIHWGTYSPIRLRRGAPAWLTTPRQAFHEAMARRGLSDVLVDVEPGGSVDVDDLGLDVERVVGADLGAEPAPLSSSAFAFSSSLAGPPVPAASRM